jgi:caffeoyl-CoA O-methyltransferase
MASTDKTATASQQGLLTLVPDEIELYAMAHTTPLPQLLQELITVTQERFGQRARMLSGQLEGTLLQMLIGSAGARRVLEIGTFTGFAAQMMAAALPDDGELITCDIDPEAIGVARSYFARSPHGRRISLREGSALETMRSLDPGFDLIFIDADKVNYINYYEEALRLLAPDGLIVVDNVLWSGRVLEPKSDDDRAIVAFNEHVARDQRVIQVILTVRDGVMLARRSR